MNKMEKNKRRKNYTLSDLKLAIKAVEDGNVSPYRAALDFNIPLTTFYNNLTGTSKSNSIGTSTILSKEDENSIEKYVISCAERGFPLGREALVDVGEKMIKLKNKNAQRPGRAWVEGFLRRHPGITFRVTQSVSKASANVSENNLRSWHAQITATLTQYDKLHIILNHPELVFNSDETNFQLAPEGGKVYAAKGAKTVYKVAPGMEKVSVTAMFCISAAGELIPPLMIYKNTYKMVDIARKMPRKLNKNSKKINLN